MNFLSNIKVELDKRSLCPIDLLNTTCDILEEAYRSKNPVWDIRELKSLPGSGSFDMPIRPSLDVSIQETRSNIDRWMENYSGTIVFRGFGFPDPRAAFSVFLSWGIIIGILYLFLK